MTDSYLARAMSAAARRDRRLSDEHFERVRACLAMIDRSFPSDIAEADAGLSVPGVMHHVRIDSRSQKLADQQREAAWREAEHRRVSFLVVVGTGQYPYVILDLEAACPCLPLPRSIARELATIWARYADPLHRFPRPRKFLSASWSPWRIQVQLHENDAVRFAREIQMLVPFRAEELAARRAKAPTAGQVDSDDPAPSPRTEGGR